MSDETFVRLYHDGYYDDGVLLHVEPTPQNSTIYVQCKCGEEFFASGKDADRTYQHWHTTHTCQYTKAEP